MKQDSETLLVVDDDDGLRELLLRYLGEQGFQVAGAADSVEMDAYLAEHPVALLILDLMLPGEDGLSIARRLKNQSDLPIIMLSARGEEVDRIVGLEVGADDYLPKPFNPRELLARIRAVLRRSAAAAQALAAEGEPRQTPLIEFGAFTLDRQQHRLSREGETITLTSGEWNLLVVLVERPNRVLSRDALMEQLTGYEGIAYDRSIDVRITRLRKKIEVNPSQPQFIRTIWGEGYLFSPNGETNS